jgi:DNA helicase-4
LITAIRQINPHVNLYCVGDDWQAINGFAGSDLRFFRDFDRYLGQAVHIELLNNYRSQKAIVEAGNALMRDLGTPGRVALSSTHESGKVYLCCAEDFSPTDCEKEKYGSNYISPMVRRIIFKQQKRRHSVALLDRKSMVSRDISTGEEDFEERTRKLSALEKNMKLLFPGAELASSTVHSFKGLEKDAVILIDVTDKCFPLIHPRWRFSRILGESIEKIILGINITLTSLGVGSLSGHAMLIMSIGTVVYWIAVPLFEMYYSTIVSTVKRCVLIPFSFLNTKARCITFSAMHLISQ